MFSEYVLASWKDEGAFVPGAGASKRDSFGE